MCMHAYIYIYIERERERERARESLYNDSDDGGCGGGEPAGVKHVEVK